MADQQKFVLDGAVCSCNKGCADGKLKVTSQFKVRIQGKLKATDKDNVILPPFFGNCNNDPKTPCIPQLQPWQDVTSKTTFSKSRQSLLEGSSCMCSMGGKVTIKDHKQQHDPVELKPASEMEIIAIKWLDENNNVIGTKLINESNFNDIVYGKKVKIEIEVKNTDNQNDATIEIYKNKVVKAKQTLKIKLNGNKGVSEELFLIPLAEYEDSFESYDYIKHYTHVLQENILYYYATVQYAGKIKKFGDEADTLKPYTYFRNYEELIGMFSTSDSGNKDFVGNYENKFIAYNPSIKIIVEDFIKKLCETDDLTIKKVEDEVKVQAKALWDSAVSQAQKGDLDDRPLYWARNKMQTYLKRHALFKNDINFEKSQVKPNTILSRIVTVFEEKSRNYTGIDFSKVPIGSKKILVTGFDPFLLNSIKKPNDYNILQSNPSGVVALTLDNNNQLGANIQTMIFPVRYADFDGNDNINSGQGEGVVEKYIKDLIPKVDMIVTISQKFEDDYDIDAFATIRRGGGDDNMNFTRVPESKAIKAATKEWIKTTLPTQFFLKASKVEVDYNYDGKKNGTLPSPGTIVYDGPGGSYLSNEIFYRVAKLREENPDKNKRIGKLPTGHFHISKIQNERLGEDLDNDEIKELLNIVKNALLEGIKGD